MGSRFLESPDDDVDQLKQRMSKIESRAPAAAESWLPSILAPAPPVRTISDVPGLSNILSTKAHRDDITDLAASTDIAIVKVDTDMSILDGRVATNAGEMARLERLVELLSDRLDDLAATSRRSSRSDFEMIESPG
jgi:hypothetical protein